MSLLAWLILCSFILLLIASYFIIQYAIGLNKAANKFEAQQTETTKKIQEARQQADELVKRALKDAKEIAIKKNHEFERIQREKLTEYRKIEDKLNKQEAVLQVRALTAEKKEQEFKAKEAFLTNEFKRVSEQTAVIEASIANNQKKLESIAQMSAQEAREELQKSIEKEAQEAAFLEIQKIEAEAEKTAQEKAQSVLAVAIQRMAGEFVADATVSVISLPSDEMKGRIIGREGRNIRAIEQATGVDIIIDDTPEAIIISCFNPVRREIAKLAIERLVADGRIHPARIQEIVEKTRLEFEADIQEVGERSAFDCGITGLNSEITTALGRLKYMTTAGQSVLQHSIETAQIAAMMAHELELDVQLVQRAALLHDIGKALPETIEGHHAKIGAEFLLQMGEPSEVVEAALKHHEDNLQEVYITTILVQAANTLSRFRPGARKEFMQRAINRLSEIEKVVEGYKGVEQAFVIKSGRELRAMIQPSVQNDGAVYGLAKTIAKRLRQESSQTNGNVKVTLIREQKATHLAK